MSEFKETTDQVWGIDRIENSPTFDELVVPVIYLWRSPACKVAKDNLTGALKHGDEVKVEQRKLRDDFLFYFVTAEVEHEGKSYHQEGWVSARLLKNLWEGL